MKKKKKKLVSLILRYLVLVLIALLAGEFFYFVFRPLTLYPVYWLLNIIYNVSLIHPNLIIIQKTLPIELVPACIAGAAYFLLLILNLATPYIKIKKRIYMVLTAFLAFLIVNILRIFVLSIMAYTESAFFDITHQLFWYFLSTLFVIIIWFAQVKYFKIKSTPFYSDLKFLYKNS